MLSLEDEDSDDEMFINANSEIANASKTHGLLPGLNTVSVKEERKLKNNVRGLKEKLAEMELALPWIERLELVTGLAPMAPEMAFKLQEQERRRENELKNMKKGSTKVDISNDPVLNDFQREMMFHRQAQAAVLEGVSRLKALGVPTKRPDDYFAQMAKSDEHMQKVRQELLKRQLAQQRSEKVRQVRQQRKLSKQLQVQSKLKRASEKRELMEEVKKFRQKKRTDLDFLEDKKKHQQGAGRNKKALLKRSYKDKKFGFGGKKRGSKLNTKESAANVSEYQRPKKDKARKNITRLRPGKSKRMKHKSKRKN